VKKGNGLQYIENRSPLDPTKEGLLSFVLFESPFDSISAICRGHRSLASLAGKEKGKEESVEKVCHKSKRKET
jgi:hypothetical protein